MLVAQPQEDTVHNRIMRDDDLLTVDEVAASMRVAKSWVYERTRRRGVQKLPHLKLGKYLRFRQAEVHQYLEKLRIA